MEYNKPHRTYEKQLELIRSRGITDSSDEQIIQMLQGVGYYRLSAYIYPFRDFLSKGEKQNSSPTQFRRSSIRDGVEWGHIEALWLFDRKLRLLLFDALEIIEIGFRTRISYNLGEIDPYGHLNVSSLEESVASTGTRGPKENRFGEWQSHYQKQQGKARNEDFVKHHLSKYGEPIPIWVAVEFLNFGSLSTLFGLMKKKDQTSLALELGINGGPMLESWIRHLNYVRNLVAHHSRTWNRIMTIKMKTPKASQVTEPLIHISSYKVHEKIYGSLAIIAHLVGIIQPGGDWNLRLAQLVKDFPNSPYLSVQVDMGFPKDWESLSIWNPTTPTRG